MTSIRRDHGETIDGNVGMEFLAAFYVPAWYEDALCAETDPESFFPEQGESVRPAKSVCARCPVQTECLAYAMENDVRHGVWGGLSAYDRSKVRKAEQRGAA